MHVYQEDSYDVSYGLSPWPGVQTQQFLINWLRSTYSSVVESNENLSRDEKDLRKFLYLNKVFLKNETGKSMNNVAKVQVCKVLCVMKTYQRLV